jgi:DNA (cytosine-5)-methyltransferase 1
MVGVDLYSGAGGMALGAKQAGINVKLAIEADTYAAATYRHNHPNAKVITDDIRKVLKIHVPGKNNGKILFGGPPCQGFSTSNQRTRSSSNPNNWLFIESLRIVESWKPDWVVFENVKGIAETEKAAFLEMMLSKLASYGYSVSWWILNAADYGVPQRRFRLFIIGSIHGIKLQKPIPTIDSCITVKDAIADLPVLRNGASENKRPYPSMPSSSYAAMLRGTIAECSNHLVTKNAPHILKRYRHIPQGGNWENIPGRLMDNYTGIYYRLKNNEPSIVIGNYRKNMLIHPTQDRGLSVREAARLQSFPDSYEFMGSIGFQQQQVGNAVPPLLAKSVFEAVINAT